MLFIEIHTTLWLWDILHTANDWCSQFISLIWKFSKIKSYCYFHLFNTVMFFALFDKFYYFWLFFFPQLLYFIIQFYVNTFFREDQETIVFELPNNPNELYKDQNENVIDSIEVIKDSWIATKVALHGVIYVFDLDATLSKIQNNKCVVKPACVLKWSDTDNYFMSCGVGSGTYLNIHIYKY